MENLITSGSEVWIDTWVSTPQRASPDQLPPPPFTRAGRFFADSTLRQTVRVSVGGQRLRLRISNLFGDRPLSLTKVSVARPAGGKAGVAAISPDSPQTVTFDGQTSVTVPAGAEHESDPVDFPLSPASNLTVTMHVADDLAGSGVTSHPGSRTTSHLASGDQVTALHLADAAPVEHWYFLSGLRIAAQPGTLVAVALGDSLTDGRGSTTNQNDRWPDRLFDRLRHDPRTAGVAVLNHGVGGGRLLSDGRGPGAVTRQIEAALARDRLRWLIVCKGINDIGTAEVTRAAQQRTARQLIAAYEQITSQVRRHGVRTYGATLPPFGGCRDYDDPEGHRRRARETVNHWIRTSGRFDAVVDFDSAVRDPSHPQRLHTAYDIGDHLHLNPAGYQALAEAIPSALFWPPGELR